MDHTGTHRDCLVLQTIVYEPLSCKGTRPYCSHLHSWCLWITLFHSLVGVGWQAAASWWLLAVRLCHSQLEICALRCFHNGGGEFSQHPSPSVSGTLPHFPTESLFPASTFTPFFLLSTVTAIGLCVVFLSALSRVSLQHFYFTFL